MAKTRQARKAASHGWPKRGEIYLTALDPAVGHEIQKTRPALVIQNDTSNRYSAVTMVAPITSTVRLPLSPLHVLLPADSSTGLTVCSVAVFNQIRAVDRKRLIKKLGSVDAWILAEADEAIEAAFGSTPSALARISHRWPDDVAHALVRAVSRLVSTPWWVTDSLSGAGVGMSADAARTSACATSAPSGIDEKCELDLQSPPTLTRAISESTGDFKTGRYEG